MNNRQPSSREPARSATIRRTNLAGCRRGDSGVYTVTGSWVISLRGGPILDVHAPILAVIVLRSQSAGHDRQSLSPHDITRLSMIGPAPSAAPMVCYPRNQERCTGDARMRDTAAG